MTEQVEENTTNSVHPEEEVIPQEGSAENDLKAQIRQEIEKELSTKYAKLGRREQALKQQQTQFETLQKQLEEQKPLAEKYKKLEQLKEQNKFQVLNELGLSYDDLVQAYVSGEYSQPDPVSSEVQQLKEQLSKVTARLQKEDQEKEHLQFQTQAEQVKAFVTDKIKESNLPLVNSIEGSYDDILQACQMIFQETGEAPPIEEVIKEAEERYQEQFDRMVNSDFGKSILDQKYSEYIKTKAEEKQVPRTLTNKVPPAPAPENSSSKEFPGKGTKEGLKYLLQRRQQNN